MKVYSSGSAEGMRRPMARALTLCAFAVLLLISFAQQSFAAAPAADVAPSRYRVGNVVYPPGVHPPGAVKGPMKQKSAKGKGVKSHAATTQPKSHDTDKGKGDD